MLKHMCHTHPSEVIAVILTTVLEAKMGWLGRSLWSEGQRGPEAAAPHLPVAHNGARAHRKWSPGKRAAPA